LWSFAKAIEELQTFFTPLVVYGRAPLIFYILHLFLCAGLGLWLALAQKIKNLNGAFTHAAGAEIVVSTRDE
jgi:uncharacterized membrane protein